MSSLGTLAFPEHRCPPFSLVPLAAEVQTMCASKVKRDGEIVPFQLLIYERGWRSGSIAICERLIHVGGRRLH